MIDHILIAPVHVLYDLPLLVGVPSACFKSLPYNFHFDTHDKIAFDHSSSFPLLMLPLVSHGCISCISQCGTMLMYDTLSNI